MSQTLAEKKRKLEELQKEVAAEEQKNDSKLWAHISEAAVKSLRGDRLRDMANSEALLFEPDAISLDTRISGWWNSALSYGGSSRFGAVVFRNKKGDTYRFTGSLVRAAKRHVEFAIQREGEPDTNVALDSLKGRKAFFESKSGEKAWPFSEELFSLVKNGKDADLKQVVMCLEEACKAWFKRMAAVLDSDNENVQEAKRRNRFCDVGLRAALDLLD